MPVEITGAWVRAEKGIGGRIVLGWFTPGLKPRPPEDHARRTPQVGQEPIFRAKNSREFDGDPTRWDRSDGWDSWGLSCCKTMRDKLREKRLTQKSFACRQKQKHL